MTVVRSVSNIILNLLIKIFVMQWFKKITFYQLPETILFGNGSPQFFF